MFKKQIQLKKICMIIAIISLAIVCMLSNKVQAAETEKYGEFYQKDGNYIIKVLPQTTVEDLKNNLEMDGNSNFVVKDAKGNIVEENSYVGSGMKLEVPDGTYTLVVTGDFSGNESKGDGRVDISDLTKVKMLLVNLITPVEKYEKDATIAELVQIKNIIVGIRDMIAPKSFAPKIIEKTANSVTVQGETTDDSKGPVEYYFKIDDGEWVSNTDKTKSTYTFEGIDTEQEHTIRMKVKDSSGNQKKTKKISTNQIFVKLYKTTAEDGSSKGTLVFTSTDRVIPEYGTVEKDYGDIYNSVFKYNYSFNRPDSWWYEGRMLSITEVAVADKIKPINTSFWFQNLKSMEKINNIENLDTSNVTDMCFMFDGCESLTELDLSNFNTSNVTDMQAMFYRCITLTELDLSNFNTTNVTYMNNMFNGCSSLTSLNVSKFDTSNVTDMTCMFNGCSSLTSLNVSNFDTSNVIDMTYMFYACKSLTSLDLSSFDTSNVTDMTGMFMICENLTNLDLSNFDTSNVTYMTCMFDSCESLTELDLSNFNTSNVTYMYGMFSWCKNLESLNVSNLDTSNVTSMSEMFEGCESLTELDLSNFNTSNVTEMHAMFYRCITLTELDLSNFDTSNVTDMESMFSDCNKLTTILVSSKWKTAPSNSSMFQGCGTDHVTVESLQASIVNLMNEYFNIEKSA